jgi:hypothetical protein
VLFAQATSSALETSSECNAHVDLPTYQRRLVSPPHATCLNGCASWLDEQAMVAQGFFGLRGAIEFENRRGLLSC